MGKFKLNLEGLKPNIKRGTVEVDIAGDSLMFPLVIKNELAFRQALSSSDIKLKSTITASGDKKAVNYVPYAKLSPSQKALVQQSEGFDLNNTNLIGLHDESVLLASSSERNYIMETVAIICNIDFDYIIDEEKGTKYIDFINEKFETNLESTDYVGIARLLFDQNILTLGVLKVIEVNIEALKRGEDVNITFQRFIARELGRNEEEWLASIALHSEDSETEEEKAKEILHQDKIKLEEEKVSQEEKPKKKVVRKPTKKIKKENTE